MNQIKRTTVLLDPEDEMALKEVTQMQRSSDMEAIRRSIRLAHQLLKWENEGGEIILEKHGKQRQLMFL